MEIRLEELAIRQAARALMKDNGERIKISWDRFIESEVVEHKVSPFGKMNIQLADMTSNTGISLHSLEEEFRYQESLQTSKSKPEYWNCLGASKSRSGEEIQSREIIGGLFKTCDLDTTVAFTDGSCLGNPWPCGAGICVFLPD